MGTQSAIVSYTSAFASWSTGWRALQQRKENTACYKYLEKTPIAYYINTPVCKHTYKATFSFFDKLKVYVFSGKTRG